MVHAALQADTRCRVDQCSGCSRDSSGLLPCLSTHQGGVSSSSGAGRDEVLLVVTGVQSRGASSAAGTTHMSAQPPAIPFVIKYIRLAE